MASSSSSSVKLPLNATYPAHWLPIEERRADDVSTDTAWMVRSYAYTAHGRIKYRYDLTNLQEYGVDMTACTRCPIGMVFPPKPGQISKYHICYRRHTNITAVQLLNLHRDFHECRMCLAVFFSLKPYDLCSAECNTTFESQLNLLTDQGDGKKLSVSTWPLLPGSQVTTPVTPTPTHTYLAAASGQPTGTPQPLTTATIPVVDNQPVMGQGTSQATDLSTSDAQEVNTLLASGDTMAPAIPVDTWIHCDSCMALIPDHPNSMCLLADIIPAGTLNNMASNFIVCHVCRNNIIYKQSAGHCGHCKAVVGYGCTLWHGHVFCGYACQHAYVVGQLKAHTM